MEPPVGNRLVNLAKPPKDDLIQEAAEISL